MKCFNCGFEFEEGVFCPECGTKVENESAVELNDEKEKEIEKEKFKLEQEKIVAEKMAHEAELLKQKNENLRLQREEEERKKALEEERYERDSRTFNGVTYNTIEEKNKAIEAYEEKVQRTVNGVTYNTLEEAAEARKALVDKEVEMDKKIWKYNTLSIWSLVLSIVSIPLLFTCFLWIPSSVVSLALGIKALNLRTQYKSRVIVSIVFNSIVIVIGVLIILLFLSSFILPEFVQYIDKVNSASGFIL